MPASRVHQLLSPVSVDNHQSSDQQQLVTRDDAFREDGQAHPVWGAAVCCPRHACVCDNGEVCQAHTWCQERGSHRVLAGGGGFHRLCDLCDPAGVGSSQISAPEAAGLHGWDHTVVSAADVRGLKAYRSHHSSKHHSLSNCLLRQKCLYVCLTWCLILLLFFVSLAVKFSWSNKFVSVFLNLRIHILKYCPTATDI